MLKRAIKEIEADYGIQVVARRLTENGIKGNDRKFSTDLFPLVSAFERQDKTPINRLFSSETEQGMKA